MAINHAVHILGDGVGTEGSTPNRGRLAGSLVVVLLLALGVPGIVVAGRQDGPGLMPIEASADGGPVGSDLDVGEVSTVGDSEAQPDLVADFVGGAAARVHFDDGEPVPGDLFLLMALAGSSADARVYDNTPYPLGGAEVHPEVTASNREAVRTIEDITGADVRMVGFTSAPGGGLSAGVTYAIAYLNIISGGAFTGDVVVAATGRLGLHGYVHPINAIDEKTAAAGLAGADVLFTPSLPSAELTDAHGARVVGELFRARNTGAALSGERQWNHYHAWGANRPTGAMDVVGIRHIGDVAAYLCGAGSDGACDIVELLEDVGPDTALVAPQHDAPDGQRSGSPIGVADRLR